MKLIVGLGNAGPEHARNRHNVGFRCLDYLAERHGLAFSKQQERALIALGKILDTKIILAKPLTYMNLSGQAVGALVRRHKVPLADLLVVCDDMDLPLAKIRLRPRGGSGGHKGLESIIENLGSSDFSRLRVGIGRPEPEDAVDYVLSDFTADEEIVMAETYATVTEAVHTFLDDGILAAMNRFN
ncbi:MAG: aminoacyl-tRNA hydrolase [Anaerolineae bacterium]